VATSLDRRIAVLEAMAAPATGIELITRFVISSLPNRVCLISGQRYELAAGESQAEFEDRMRSVALGLRRGRGEPMRLIFTPS
jgi:hypothetical protein